MNPPEHRGPPATPAELSDQAASWFVKIDRGLTAPERRELDAAIAAQPALAAEIEQFRRMQDCFQALPPEVVQDLLSTAESPAPWRLRRFFAPALGLAAVLLLALGLFAWRQVQTESSNKADFLYHAIDPTTRLLADGSLIRLNGDTEIHVRYTGATRHVELLRGEAYFSVEKDPARPFHVAVEDLRIEAIGTAFNVKRAGSVEVIVTEGTVRLNDRQNTGHSVRPSPAPFEIQVSAAVAPAGFVSKGQRAEIYFEETRPVAIRVVDTETREVEERLFWRQSLLTLDGQSLADIAASFEQKTGHRLILTDPSLHDLQIGGRFPSDDVRGFIRILHDGYGITWREPEKGTFVLEGRR